MNQMSTNEYIEQCVTMVQLHRASKTLLTDAEELLVGPELTDRESLAAIGTSPGRPAASPQRADREDGIIRQPHLRRGAPAQLDSPFPGGQLLPHQLPHALTLPEPIAPHDEEVFALGPKEELELNQVRIRIGVRERQCKRERERIPDRGCARIVVVGPAVAFSLGRPATHEVSVDSQSISGSIASIGRKSRSKAALNVNTSISILAVSPESLRSSPNSPLESKKLNSLQMAVHKGDVKKVRSLLAEKKRDVNKVDTFHRFTALHLAAEENRLEIAAMLLDPMSAITPPTGSPKKSTELVSPLKKCNPDCLNQEERTPLSVAIIHGHMDMAKLLLDHGASPNIPDILGCTSLHYAILTKSNNGVKLLMDKSPQLDIIDKSGLSYLHHAVRLKDAETVEVLIAGGANLNNIGGTDKSTALHLAVETSQEYLVKLLLSKGADPSIVDGAGRNALERVNHSLYNQEIVDMLTVKLLEQEARQSLGKRTFLEPNADERTGGTSSSRSGGPRSAVEETEIVAMSVVATGSTRMQQSMAREVDYQYSREKSGAASAAGKGKAALVKRATERQPGDPTGEEDSIDLSDESGSPLNLSEPSDDDLSMSEEDHGSDSAMWSALGLSKADREEAKKRKTKGHLQKGSTSSASLSLGSINEDSQDGVESRKAPLRADLKTETDISDIEEEIDSHSEPVERPLGNSEAKKAPSSRDEGSDLLDILGDTDDFSALSATSNSMASSPIKLSALAPSLPVLPETRLSQASAAGNSDMNSGSSPIDNLSDSSPVQDDPTSRGDEDVSHSRQSSTTNGDVRSFAASATGRQRRGSVDEVVNERSRRASAASNGDAKSATPSSTNRQRRGSAPSIKFDSPTDDGSAVSEARRRRSSASSAHDHERGRTSSARKSVTSHGDAPSAVSEHTEEPDAASSDVISASISEGRNSIDANTDGSRKSTSSRRRASGSDALPLIQLRPPSTEVGPPAEEKDSPPPVDLPALPPLPKAPDLLPKDDETMTRLKSLLQPHQSPEQFFKHLSDLARHFENQPLQPLLTMMSRNGTAIMDSQRAANQKISRMLNLLKCHADGIELAPPVDRTADGIEVVQAKEHIEASMLRADQELDSMDALLREKEEALEAKTKEAKKLEEDLARLAERCRGLEGREEALQRELQAMQAEMRAQVSACKAEADVELGEARAKEEALQAKVRKLSEELRQAETARQEDAEALVSVRKDLTLEIDRRSASQREKKYLRQMLKGYRTSSDSINVSKDDGTTPGGGTVSESDDDEATDPYRGYIAQLEEDNLTLQRRVTGEGEDRAVLEKQIEEARFHSEEVADELDELARALKAEKSGGLALEERVAILQLDLEASATRCKRLEENLKEKEEERAAKVAELREEVAKADAMSANAVKITAELESLREERAADQTAIESRNTQIESLRTQVKELVMKHQDFAAASARAETSQAGATTEIKEDVIQYYENEIKILNQQFEEEKEIRLAREVEHKRVLQSLIELEGKLGELKRRYEKQLQVTEEKETSRGGLARELESSQADVLQYQKRINDLEVAAIRARARIQDLEEAEADNRTKGDKDMAVKKEEVENLRRAVTSLEREKAECELQNVTAKMNLEEKTTKLLEVERQLAASKIESDRLRNEVRDLKQQMNSELEETSLTAEDRLKQIDKIRNNLKEKEHRVAELENEVFQTDTRLKELQLSYEKKVREAEQVRQSSQSQVEDLEAEIQKLSTNLAHSKTRYGELETTLNEANAELEESKEKITRLVKQLENERRKTERFFKSNDNLRSKLTSFVDLGPEQLPADGTTADLRGSHANQFKFNSTRTSMFDVGGIGGNTPTAGGSADPIARLRELKAFAEAELKGVDSCLSGLNEELGRDLTRIAALMADISADVDMDTEIRDLITRLLHSQNARVGEARSTVQASRVGLTATAGQLVGGIEGFRDAFDKEVRRQRSLREEAERASLEATTALEEVKKKKAGLQQQLADWMAKVEVLEEEKVTMGRRVREVTNQQKMLEEKDTAVESAEKALVDLQRRLAAAEAGVKAKTVAFDAADERATDLAGQVERLTAKLKQLEKDSAKMGATLVQKTKQTTELEEQLKDATEKLSVAEKELREIKVELQKNTSTFDSTIKEVREKLTASAEEASISKRAIDTADMKTAELKDMLKALQAQLAEEKIAGAKCRGEMEQELTQLRQSKVTVEMERARAEEALKTAREQLEENKRRATGLEKSVTSLEDQKQDLSNTIYSLELSSKKLRTEAEDHLTVRRRLEMEVVSLKEERSRRASLVTLNPSQLLSSPSSQQQLHTPATSSPLRDAREWEIERADLQAELDRRSHALAQAERDALTIARQLRETSSRLSTLQAQHERVEAMRAAERAIPSPNATPMSPMPVGGTPVLFANDGALHGQPSDAAFVMLRRELEVERASRAEADHRTDRLKRQLEEEISGLVSARKRLEEREGDAEHRRRAAEMKVAEMQDQLESERSMKHRHREESHGLQLKCRELEAEIGRLKRGLEGAGENTEATRQMRARLAQVEEENAQLKAKLADAESRQHAVEAKAKHHFDHKLRKVAVRLEEQSKERERVEAQRVHAEQEMKERYEKRIDRLSGELASAKRMVDMSTARARAPPSRPTKEDEEDIYRQISMLKRSHNTITAKLRNIETVIPPSASSSPQRPRDPRKLKFSELVGDDASDATSSPYLPTSRRFMASRSQHIRDVDAKGHDDDEEDGDVPTSIKKLPVKAGVLEAPGREAISGAMKRSAADPTVDPRSGRNW
ncbi:hypothetical protein HK101_003884 [Irineochytrium annulatum]|nr:hypothetical protein HK101_003884 [Irineochytrium annulatum]